MFNITISVADLDETSRPLDEAYLNRLRVNQTFLIENLRLKDLLNSLFACDVISPRQKDHIIEYNKSSDRIGELLDIMRRRSVHQFRLFLQCLRDTEQGFIADIIMTDEAGRLIFQCIHRLLQLLDATFGN